MALGNEIFADGDALCLLNDTHGFNVSCNAYITLQSIAKTHPCELLTEQLFCSWQRPQQWTALTLSCSAYQFISTCSMWKALNVNLGLIMSWQTIQRRLCMRKLKRQAWYRSKTPITMGAILGNLEVIMEHNRWQVIRVDFNLRGDDSLRTSSLAPLYSHLIAPVQHMSCYAKNAASCHYSFQPVGRPGMERTLHQSSGRSFHICQ